MKWAAADRSPFGNVAIILSRVSHARPLKINGEDSASPCASLPRHVFLRPRCDPYDWPTSRNARSAAVTPRYCASSKIENPLKSELAK